MNPYLSRYQLFPDLFTRPPFPEPSEALQRARLVSSAQVEVRGLGDQENRSEEQHGRDEVYVDEGPVGDERPYNVLQDVACDQEEAEQ